MQHDKVYQKYYDEVVILLETGLRISELSGLTDTDLDFENRFGFSHIERKPGKPGVTGYTGI